MKLARLPETVKYLLDDNLISLRYHRRMELRHLRYFVAVAEELHFRRAAERLNIAQPALSQQIRRLEAELRAQLLLRTKREVRLTDAGRVLLEDARRILADVDRAVRATWLTSRGESGELAVGSTHAGEVAILPRILPIFQQRFPKVSVAVESLGTPGQIEALRSRRIQVGLLRLPCDNQGLLTIEVILREPLVVALSESHPLAARQSIPLRALAREPYIGFPRLASPGFYDSLMALCRRAGFSLNVYREVDHFQTQLSLIALGFGLALVPASTQWHGRQGVVYRPLSSPGSQAAIGMAYRRDESSEVLRTFTGVVREVMNAMAGNARGPS
jgi:DNA-binding transcriptional LysR family regulator